MAKDVDVLKSLADQIKNEVEDGKNTATRVGSLLGDIVDAIKDALTNVAHPVSITNTTSGDFEISDESGNVLVRFSNGHVKTKNFDSSNIPASSGSVDLSGYQPKLVSGTNIKTINGLSLLGSGNLSISGSTTKDGSEIGQRKFRFMHWNIGHYCNGNGTSTGVTSSTYAAKKKAFREVFNKYAADIVGLCEYSSIFYGTESASNAILCQYKYHHIAPTESGYVGLAIHSALQITNLTEISLGTNTAYEGVIYVGGKKVIICECHLPWNSQSAHDTAMNILLNRYANEDNVVIGGDFNFFVGDSTHTAYTEQYKTWTDAGYQTANCGYMGDILTSYNNVINTNYLDTIFVKGGCILKTEVHQVTPSGKDANNPQKADETLWDSVNLSDHFPIIAEIVF